MKRADYLLFAIVYFVQGALTLTSVALPIFLREMLDLSIPQIAVLMAIASIPWTLKPIYGVLTDYYPIHGKRRKPYILMMTGLASLGWLLTAINGSYWTVLLAQIAAALGIAATDVAIDGLAVEKSTPKNKGLIQSVCWGSRSVGAVAAGITGGVLLSFISARAVFFITALLPLLAFSAALFVKEKSHPKTKEHLGAFVGKLLHSYGKMPLLWWTALFLLVWYAAPSFGTPLFFYLKDALGVSEAQLGLLTSVSSFGGIVGALLFSNWLDRISQKKLFITLIFLSSALALVFYAVLGLVSAIIVYFLNGMLAILITIASMKLIVGVCPSRFEATTFALMTSITNLGSGVFAGALGGYLYAMIGYENLILLNAGWSLLPLVLVPKIFR